VKKMYIISILAAMIITPQILSAEETFNYPVSLRAAIDISYLSYMETNSEGALDGDTGWLKGLFLEGRYDSYLIFLSLFLSATGTDSATYLGQYQNGTATSNTTSEYILLTEADAGYKVYNSGPASIAPYAGIGYRHWARGENNASTGDYVEFYYWYYFNAGIECSARSGDILLSAGGGIYIPQNMKMKTSVNGYYDTAVFKLGSKPGYHLEGMVDYTINKNSDMAASVFFSPYYQQWNIGKSGDVTMKRNGTPVGEAYEPDSYTHIMGYRFGVCFYL
jgi:hypothetical protein